MLLPGSMESRARAVALVLCLLSSACEAMLESPLGPSGGPSDDGSGPSGDGDGLEGECAPALAPRLVLLSDFQQANAIRSLLGDDAMPDDGTLNAAQKPFTQKGVVVNTSLVHGRLSWAEQAGAAVRARFTEVTGCADNGTEGCARRFIGEFAPRVFRRPVEPEEIDDLMAVFAVGNEIGFVDGVVSMVEAALSSPSFMYRSELGKPNDDGTVSLTNNELATSLSFLLTDAPPDAELMQAAERGDLDDDGKLSAQIERMLDSDVARQSLVSTVMAAWGASNLFGTVKDPTLFPEYNPGLAASMFHETELFLDDVFWQRNAPLKELLTGHTGFVNPALAAVYGVPYPGQGDAFVKVDLGPERAGVLTQASLMTMLSRTDNTSVVARGLFVRGALLCLPKIPSPPASLTGAIEELLEADMNERERADVRAQTQPCGGCHAGFDAFGLMLENFDPLGRVRTVLDDAPVETWADVAQPVSLAKRYENIAEFATAAAEGPEFTSCVATKLLAYATGDEELTAQDCRVKGLLQSIPSETPSLREVVHAVAQSPALRLRVSEKSP